MIRYQRTAPFAIMSSVSSTRTSRVAGPGRPYLRRMAWISRHCAISTRITPDRVGTPRLGSPFTGACGGLLGSGVRSTLHVVDGRRVRASLTIGAEPGQRPDGVTMGESVIRGASDVAVEGCPVAAMANAGV